MDYATYLPPFRGTISTTIDPTTWKSRHHTVITAQGNPSHCMSEFQFRFYEVGAEWLRGIQKTTWSINSELLFVIERSLSASLPSTIPSADTSTCGVLQEHTVCVYLFFRPRYSVKTCQKKQIQSKLQISNSQTSQALRTTHFFGNVVEIIISPKGHLRRSAPQILGSESSEQCQQTPQSWHGHNEWNTDWWKWRDQWRDPYFAYEIIPEYNWVVVHPLTANLTRGPTGQCSSDADAAQCFRIFQISRLQAEVLHRLLEQQSCRFENPTQLKSTTGYVHICI